MSSIYLARHGETNWNRAGRYQGRLDEARLTDLGRQQAQALAQALKRSGATRVISSPLQRCLQTAQPLAEKLGCSVEVDDRLVEIGHGTWEGRLRSEVERDEPELFRLWQVHPDLVQFRGGESLAAVRDRWQALVHGLRGSDTVALVTHDVLVRLAILDATDDMLEMLWRPRVVNGGFARLEVGEQARSLVAECVEEHLSGRMADTRVQAL